MSYILVTYGYNQFSLFNIKTSTPTLIDKIKEVSFQSIIQKLQARDKSLQKELDQGVIEEEKLNKLKSATEQDLQIEKDKYDEAVKQLEAKRKKEEMEQKKKEAEAKEAKGKKKEEKKTQEKKKGKAEKKVVEETVDDKPIVELKDKLDKINEDINVLNNNKNINNDKKSKVQQFLGIFTKKFKERMKELKLKKENDALNLLLSYKSKKNNGVRSKLFDYEIKQRQNKINLLKKNKSKFRNLSSQKPIRYMSNNYYINNNENEYEQTNEYKNKPKVTSVKNVKLPPIKVKPSSSPILEEIPILHKDFGKMPEYLEKRKKEIKEQMKMPRKMRLMLMEIY